VGVNSLPKTVTRHRRDCDLNLGPSAPESSMLATRLPSHLQLQQTRSLNSEHVYTNWSVHTGVREHQFNSVQLVCCGRGLTHITLDRNVSFMGH